MLDYEGDYFEPYCDYCESEGHTFRSCRERDDLPENYYDQEDEE